MLKRILSLIITLAMCAGMVTIPAMAEGEETTTTPVFYEGETFYSEDFSYETTADFDTANTAANTAKNPSITINKTNYEIVNGILVGSYDETNTGDRICLSLGSQSLKTGKYAIEYDVALVNGQYFPKRLIGRPWAYYYASAEATKTTSVKAALATFGYSTETNNQFLFEQDSKIYKEYVNEEFYSIKYVLDVDSNKYYAYFEDELVINGKAIVSAAYDFDYLAPFDLIVQSPTERGIYDYKNMIDNVKFYRVYTEDELPAFTLASSTIENGATEVSVGAGSVSLTLSNKIDETTISNAAITGLTSNAVVTPALSEDGKTLTLSWNELAYGETYTVDLSGVKDTYQQNLSGESISFSTTSKPPVFYEVDEIYAQNFDGANVTVNNCGLVIPTNTTATIQNGKLNLAYDSEVFTSGTSIVQYNPDGGLNWENGKYALELKVSMTNGDSYPRRVIGNLRSGGSNVIQGAYTGNNNKTNSKILYVDKISQGTVVDGQEYLFKFVYDMDNNICYSYLDGELITKEGRAFDKADSAGTLIFLLQQDIDNLNGTAGGDFKMTNTIDDIRIYEVYKEGEIPALKVSSSTIENNAENISNKAGDVSITFSNKIDSTTIANAFIKGGSEAPVVTPSLDKAGKTLTLTWNEALEYDTVYTVDFSGVKDILNQSPETGTITFTTKKDYVKSGDYILAQDFSNTTVEDCGLKITNATSEITSDGKLYLTYSSSMSDVGTVTFSLPSDGYWYPKTTNAETGEVTGGGKYAIEMKLSMTNNDATGPQRALVNLRGAATNTSNASINTLGYVGTSGGTSKLIYLGGWNSYENTVNNKEYSLKFIVDMDNLKYYVYVNGEKFATASTDEFPLNETTQYYNHMWLLRQSKDTAAGGTYEMTNTLDDIYIYPVTLVEHNAPEMVTTVPAEGTTDISEETSVQITFDEEIDLDSVNDSTLYVTGSSVNILEKSLSEDNKTLTVTFDDDLTFETEQTVTVNGIKSIYGKAMAEASFKFTTREGYLKVMENNFTIDGEAAKVLKKGTLKAERKVFNFSDKDYTATLILALYKGKSLVNVVSFENQTIKTGEKGTLKGELAIPELTGDETYTLRAFLWDSVQGMIPLENPAEISNK